MDKVLQEVKECWKLKPELQFGYLIASIIRSGKLQLEISDQDFITKCKEMREFPDE
jgi:hypothetical protein